MMQQFTILRAAQCCSIFKTTYMRFFMMDDWQNLALNQYWDIFHTGLDCILKSGLENCCNFTKNVYKI